MVAQIAGTKQNLGTVTTSTPKKCGVKVPLKLVEDNKSLKSCIEKFIETRAEDIKKAEANKPPKFEQRGWVCPVCGSGNAPWVVRCPCVSDVPRIWPPHSPQPWYGPNIVWCKTGRNSESLIC